MAKRLVFSLLLMLTAGCSTPVHSFYVVACNSSHGAQVEVNMPGGSDVAASECMNDSDAHKLADDLNRALWEHRASR